MTHFPQIHKQRRAVRLEFQRTLPAAIRFEDGRHFASRLTKISLTGGLLHLRTPLVPGILMEIVFLSQGGPVLGLAELMSPASSTLKCLQPFKFLMLDEDDYRRLNTLIASRTDGANPATQPLLTLAENFED